MVAHSTPVPRDYKIAGVKSKKPTQISFPNLATNKFFKQSTLILIMVAYPLPQAKR